MLLTGRRIDGLEALMCGMVTRLFPKERLHESAEEIARNVASFDPAVVRQTKKSVIQGMDMTLEQGLALEKRLAEQCRS